MEPAVFLVTALADVKKESFGAKLHELMDQQIPVKIILASLNFADHDFFDRLLTTLTADYQQKPTVTTLYAIFKAEKGVALSAAALKHVDTEKVQRREFKNADGSYYVRWLDGDNLLAETHYQADDKISYQDFYTENELVQKVYYGGQDQPELITNYQTGAVKESLLLNAQGELVYRFVRETRPVRRLFNLNASSSIQLTDIRAAQPDTPKTAKKQLEQKNTLTVVEEQEPVYRVMDYVDFARYQNIYDFYRQVLNRVSGATENLYINIDHNVEISTTLPHKLIFNY